VSEIPSVQSKPPPSLSSLAKQITFYEWQLADNGGALLRWVKRAAAPSLYLYLEVQPRSRSIHHTRLRFIVPY
jgi:hypothetical protein